jgi:hemolysin activation/secretion protein
LFLFVQDLCLQVSAKARATTPAIGWGARALCISVGVAASLAPCPASAQLAAPPASLVTPKSLRPETPPATPPELPQAAPLQAPSGAENISVTLGDIKVEGGFPEFAAATGALIADARGRKLSVADFFKLANAIEDLYHAGGYPLVRLTVPPQHVNNGGTLRLIVVDGFIEQIDDQGLAERARNRVEAQLAPLVGQRHVTEAAIERALTLAGQEPGVTLRSALGAGKEPGGVLLVIEGEQSLTTTTFEVDNRLAPSLGTWESTLQFALNQPFQLGEQFYGYVSGDADEHPFSTYSPRRVAGGGIQFPLGSDGLVLNPEYTWSLTKPIATGLTIPEVSRFERETLRLIYPAVLDHGQSLTLTTTIDATTETDILPLFAAVLDKDQTRVGRINAEWNDGLSWGGKLQAWRDPVERCRRVWRPRLRASDIERDRSVPL